MSRELIGGATKVVATSVATLDAAETVNFDFGDPADLNFANRADFDHGDRLLVVFTATGGTADTVSFSVQDAADNGSGAIGTPAAAKTDGDLSGGTGDLVAITGVLLQPRRPWLRARATKVGTADEAVTVTATVLAIPGVL